MRRAFPIQQGQRVFIVGKTRSGKSTTVRYVILPFLPNRFIVDPKGEFSYPNSRIIENPEELSNIKPDETQTIIYRPHPDFMFVEFYNAIYKWVYLRGNTTCYTDEVIQIMNGNTAPHYFRVCQTAGASRGISMINGTQRPSCIPVPILTEAEHYFMHYLGNPDDMDRMAGYMHGVTEITVKNYEHFCVHTTETGNRTPVLPRSVIGKSVPTVKTVLHGKHNFFYYNLDTGEPTSEHFIRMRKGG